MTDWVLVIETILASIVSIVVISNPLSTSAVFIALTKGMGTDEKAAIVRRTIRISAMVLILFALTGFLIFQLFGFTVGAFRIAGGVLLMTTALDMMRPEESSTQAERTSADIAIMPLAIPFTAGPGTIVTVVLLMSGAQANLDTDLVYGIVSMAGVLLAIVVALFVSYYVMMQSERVDAFLQEGGRSIVTKLMGLIVLAIAVQFIINGVIDIVPDLVSAVQEALS